MDPDVLAKLRQAQALHELPGGGEGIDVTLQFVGTVPCTTRAERKDWLANRFASINAQLSETVELKPTTLSTSAQSMQAVVPVTAFESIRDQLSADSIRVEVTRSFDVLERSE